MLKKQLKKQQNNMKDQKTTKGKWTVSESLTYVYSNCSDDPCRNFVVARCDNGGITEEELKANVQLIATAPELLYQLEYMTNLAIEACRFHGNNPDTDKDIQNALSTINKAKTIAFKDNTLEDSDLDNMANKYFEYKMNKSEGFDLVHGWKKIFKEAIKFITNQ